MQTDTLNAMLVREARRWRAETKTLPGPGRHVCPLEQMTNHPSCQLMTAS
jgi:hypothetical protein